MKIRTTLGAIKKIERELNKLKSKKLVVGVVGREADIKEGGRLSVREYAILNEYGTSKIPARPFFRTAIEFGDSPKIIEDVINGEIRNVIREKKTSDQALKSIGLFVKGRIQKSLRSGNWTPNAPSTLKRKRKKKGGAKKPLVDTGSLLRSIDYEIKNR